MAVQTVQYENQILDIQPVDTASVFVTKCGQNNYYMDPNTQGFCRDSIFSLTTDYNNGALSCECNSEGSLSFNCEEFGGQCRCRPNVIGRTCSQCRTGFYGFPNCRPCNCPSGLCDPVSGQCVCPPRVTGPTCNVCLPRTFGFDRLIGCEVRSSNLFFSTLLNDILHFNIYYLYNLLYCVNCGHYRTVTVTSMEY